MKTSRLKCLRIEYGYSQAELGKILFIGQNSLSDYELGKRPCPIDLLMQLADLYGVSVDYLMGRTDVKEPYPRR